MGPDSTPLERRIRVVLFTSGPSLEDGLRELLCRLEAHPDIELCGVFWESNGTGLRDVWSDLWRRRGMLAPALAALDLARRARRWLHPGREQRLRAALDQIGQRVHVVSNMHAEAVLARLGALQPDLGLSYGSPILRHALFEIPTRGTLGIHHGKLPEYRGKKTPFWAIHAGEPSAGVTIQRLCSKLDAGEIVREGEVRVGRRTLGGVWRRLEALGVELYLEAILAVHDGSARYEPARGAKGPLFRDPTPLDIAVFWGRWLQRLVRRGPREPVAVTRVLILTETYAPEVGGGETQARALAEGLVARGMRVGLLTRRSRPESARLESIGGVEVHRMGPTGRGQRKKWALLVSLLPVLVAELRSADVAIVCGYRILGIAVVPLCRLFRVPCILKADSQGEHSGAFFQRGLEEVGLSAGSWPVRAALALRDRLIRRADRFVAISQAIVAELVRHGVPEDRILRIPNGVDVEDLRPVTPSERARLRRHLGLPDEARIVVYTGRLVRYKGLLELVDAWPEIRSGRPDAHLVLVGSGGLDVDSCEAELRQRVERLGLEACVRFTGAVPDVADWLRTADVFAFPSRNEAFGLAPVEAMATGLAVASTHCGGLSDIVRHDETGIVVEPNAASLRDGIGRLLDDEGLRGRLGEAGRRDVALRFSIESVVARYASAVAALTRS